MEITMVDVDTEKPPEHTPQLTVVPIVRAANKVEPKPVPIVKVPATLEPKTAPAKPVHRYTGIATSTQLNGVGSRSTRTRIGFTSGDNFYGSPKSGICCMSANL